MVKLSNKPHVNDNTLYIEAYKIPLPCTDQELHDEFISDDSRRTKLAHADGFKIEEDGDYLCLYLGFKS